MTTEYNQPLELEPHGFFADRETLDEAFKYAEKIAKGMGDQEFYVLTAMMVIYNTLANHYHIIPKK